MENTFLDAVRGLSRRLKEQESQSEAVRERDVVRAYSVLNFIKYENVSDVFLGCAAINLLNAYVKRKGAQIGYSFKSHLGAILNAIDRLNSFMIKVGYDNADKMHLLQIDIGGFHFSYKSIEQTDLVDELAGKIPWDGIRKQPQAANIFDFALSSMWLTNVTLDGDDLRVKVEKDAVDYDNGAFEFRRGRLVKIANVEHKKKSLTALSNYLREKFREARGELVLLEANFAKIWPHHVTFTSVRPHISAINSVVVCDHINLHRETLESCVNLHSLKRGETYFILGYCDSYAEDRMGVKIAQDLDHCPILSSSQFGLITNTTFAKIHRFGIGEFLANKQKVLLYR